jgi:hypothetical protein
MTLVVDRPYAQTTTGDAKAAVKHATDKAAEAINKNL